MSTELEPLIKAGFDKPTDKHQTDKFYSVFLRSDLLIPVQLNPDNIEEPYTPLFTQINQHFFLVCFDHQEKFDHWAGDCPEIDSRWLTGHQLMDKIGFEVYLALNPGSDSYKELSPAEVLRLKRVVWKTQRPARAGDATGRSSK